MKFVMHRNLTLPNITLKEETVVGRNCRKRWKINCRGNYLLRTLENLIVAGINCRELLDE